MNEVKDSETENGLIDSKKFTVDMDTCIESGDDTTGSYGDDRKDGCHLGYCF